MPKDVQFRNWLSTDTFVQNNKKGLSGPFFIYSRLHCHFHHYRLQMAFSYLHCMPSSSTLLEVAISAALAAGTKIMKVYVTPGFRVTYKQDRSPVTEADHSASKIIIKKLAAT